MQSTYTGGTFGKAVRLLRVTNGLRFYPRLRKRLLKEAYRLIDRIDGVSK